MGNFHTRSSDELGWIILTIGLLELNDKSQHMSLLLPALVYLTLRVSHMRLFHNATLFMRLKELMEKSITFFWFIQDGEKNTKISFMLLTQALGHLMQSGSVDYLRADQ